MVTKSLLNMQNDLIVGHLVNHNIFLGYTGRLLAQIGRWVCWLLIPST